MKNTGRLATQDKVSTAERWPRPPLAAPLAAVWSSSCPCVFCRWMPKAYSGMHMYRGLLRRCRCWLYLEYMEWQ